MAAPLVFPIGFDNSSAKRSAAEAVDYLQRRLNAVRPKALTKSLNNLPLGKINANLDQFEQSLAASNARVLAFGATTGILYGISRAFKTLVSDAIEVEKAIANIQVVLRATDTELSKFSSSLFDIANSTGQAFSVAAEAAAEFARQGIGVAKTLEAVEAALILTRLTGLKAEESVKALTAAVNTFNVEGVKYADVVNTMANVDTAFAVSSDDLVRALQRVGSTAVDAGVSMKELMALVTSLQQTTARGGSIIGNGLKSIFTRLQRSRVQQALNNIGVATRESNGEFRSATRVLQDLSQVYDQLTDSQKAQVSELTAGVFQINTIKGLFADLGKDVSIYQQALDVANRTTNEAYQKNAFLNNTLSSKINEARNSLSEFNSELAGLGVKSTFGDLLDAFTKGVSGLGESLASDDNNLGDKLGKGLVKGIIQAISGPGLIAVAKGLSGLASRVVFDAFKGGSSVLFGGGQRKFSQFLVKEMEQRNAAAEKYRSIEESVNRLLQTGNQTLVKKLESTNSLVERQRIFNQLLKQETAERARQSAMVNKLIASQVGATAGIKGAKKVSGRIAAGGHVPMAAEAYSIARGVGGARRTAKPVEKSVRLKPGRAERVVVNTDEHIVRNYMGSGADAVFNRQMTRQAGGASNLRKFGKVENVFAVGALPSISKPLPPSDPSEKASFNTVGDKVQYRNQTLRDASYYSVIQGAEKTTLKRLRLGNPYNVDARNADKPIAYADVTNKGLIHLAAQRGHDGAVMRNIQGDVNKEATIVAFKRGDGAGKSFAGGRIPNVRFGPKKTITDTFFGDKIIERRSKAGSLLRYSDDADAIRIKYIESERRGEGFAAFNEIVKLSKSTKKAIHTSDLTPQVGRFFDTPKAVTGNGSMDFLLNLFPQLRYRAQKGLRTSGTFSLEGVDTKFSSIKDLAKKMERVPKSSMQYIKDIEEGIGLRGLITKPVSGVGDAFAGGVLPRVRLYRGVKGKEGLNNAKRFGRTREESKKLGVNIQKDLESATLTDQVAAILRMHSSGLGLTGMVSTSLDPRVARTFGPDIGSVTLSRQNIVTRELLERLPPPMGKSLIKLIKKKGAVGFDVNNLLRGGTSLSREEAEIALLKRNALRSFAGGSIPNMALGSQMFGRVYGKKIPKELLDRVYQQVGGLRQKVVGQTTHFIDRAREQQRITDVEARLLRGVKEVDLSNPLFLEFFKKKSKIVPTGLGLDVAGIPVSFATALPRKVQDELAKRFKVDGLGTREGFGVVPKTILTRNPTGVGVSKPPIVGGRPLEVTKDGVRIINSSKDIDLLKMMYNINLKGGPFAGGRVPSNPVMQGDIRNFMKGRNTFQVQWIKANAKLRKMDPNDPNTVVKLGKEFANLYGSNQALFPFAGGFVPNMAINPSRVTLYRGIEAAPAGIKTGRIFSRGKGIKANKLSPDVNAALKGAKTPADVMTILKQHQNAVNGLKGFVSTSTSRSKAETFRGSQLLGPSGTLGQVNFKRSNIINLQDLMTMPRPTGKALIGELKARGALGFDLRSIFSERGLGGEKEITLLKRTAIRGGLAGGHVPNFAPRMPFVQTAFGPKLRKGFDYSKPVYPKIPEKFTNDDLRRMQAGRYGEVGRLFAQQVKGRRKISRGRGERLGAGVFGEFYKLQGDVGVKRIKRLDEGVNQAIRDEFFLSKYLGERQLLAGVGAPKVLGSAKRSVEAKRIGKEVAKDPLASSHGLRGTEGSFGSLIERALRAKGVNLSDLHGNNFTLNKKGADFLRANETRINLQRTDIRDPEAFLKKFKAAGGRAQIIDAGYVGNVHKLLSSKYPEYAKASKREASLDVFAEGRIPNLAKGPLGDAVARERAAGVPKSQIYVGQSNLLKSGSNPMGLGVANRRDEPGGIMQGVRRAQREGRDPRSYGGALPNFSIVSDKKLLLDKNAPIRERMAAMDRLVKSDAKTSRITDRTLAKLSKEGGTLGSSANTIAKSRGIFSDPKKMQRAGFPPSLQIASPREGKSAPKGSGLPVVRKPKGAPTISTRERLGPIPLPSIGSQAQRFYGPSFRAVPPTPKLRPIPPIQPRSVPFGTRPFGDPVRRFGTKTGVNPRGRIIPTAVPSTAGSRFRSGAALPSAPTAYPPLLPDARRDATAAVKQSVDQRLQANPTMSSKDIRSMIAREVKDARITSKDLGKSFEKDRLKGAKRARAGQFQSRAFALSFAASALGGITGEFTTPSIGKGINDIASLTTTGALIGGVPGALVGGALGLGKVGLDAGKRTAVPLEKMAKAANNVASQFEKASNAAAEYVGSQSQLNSVLKDPTSRVGDIRVAFQRTALAEANLAPDVLQKVQGAETIEEKNRILQSNQIELTSEKNAVEALTAFGKRADDEFGKLETFFGRAKFDDIGEASKAIETFAANINVGKLERLEQSGNVRESFLAGEALSAVRQGDTLKAADLLGDLGLIPKELSKGLSSIFREIGFDSTQAKELNAAFADMTKRVGQNAEILDLERKSRETVAVALQDLAKATETAGTLADRRGILRKSALSDKEAFASVYTKLPGVSDSQKRIVESDLQFSKIRSSLAGLDSLAFTKGGGIGQGLAAAIGDPEAKTAFTASLLKRPDESGFSFMERLGENIKDLQSKGTKGIDDLVKKFDKLSTQYQAGVAETRDQTRAILIQNRVLAQIEGKQKFDAMIAALGKGSAVDNAGLTASGLRARRFLSEKTPTQKRVRRTEIQDAIRSQDTGALIRIFEQNKQAYEEIIKSINAQIAAGANPSRFTGQLAEARRGVAKANLVQRGTSIANLQADAATEGSDAQRALQRSAFNIAKAGGSPEALRREAISLANLSGKYSRKDDPNRNALRDASEQLIGEWKTLINNLAPSAIAKVSGREGAADLGGSLGQLKGLAVPEDPELYSSQIKDIESILEQIDLGNINVALKKFGDLAFDFDSTSLKEGGGREKFEELFSDLTGYLEAVTKETGKVFDKSFDPVDVKSPQEAFESALSGLDTRLATILGEGSPLIKSNTLLTNSVSELAASLKAQETISGIQVKRTDIEKERGGLSSRAGDLEKVIAAADNGLNRKRGDISAFAERSQDLAGVYGLSEQDLKDLSKIESFAEGSSLEGAKESRAVAQRLLDRARKRQEEAYGSAADFFREENPAPIAGLLEKVGVSGKTARGTEDFLVGHILKQKGAVTNAQADIAGRIASEDAKRFADGLQDLIKKIQALDGVQGSEAFTPRFESGFTFDGTAEDEAAKKEALREWHVLRDQIDNLNTTIGGLKEVISKLPEAQREAMVGAEASGVVNLTLNADLTPVQEERLRELMNEIAQEKINLAFENPKLTGNDTPVTTPVGE